MIEPVKVQFSTLSAEGKRTVRRGVGLLLACVVGFVASFVGIFIYLIRSRPRTNWNLVEAWGAATCLAVTVGFAFIAAWVKRLLADSPSADKPPAPADDSN